MSFEQLLFLAASLGSVGLGVVALARRPRTLATWSFSLGMFLLAMETLLVLEISRTSDPIYFLRIERLRLLCNSVLPGIWLAFSLTYARGNSKEFLRIWRIVLLGALLFPIVPTLLLEKLLAVQQNPLLAGGNASISLGWPGRIVHLFVVVGAVLILTNLERTFRASVGTLRWRIKFAILGLVLVFSVRIYTSSQALLYSTSDVGFAVFNAVALLIACILVAMSFYRASLSGTEVYPSLAVLQSSLTVVLVGAYLLAVGVLAKLLENLGGSSGFPIKAFLILLGLAVLGLALGSDRLRFAARRFVSRHFHRPLYDYRSLWRNFTERTSSLVDERSYSRELAHLIANSVQALSASVWLADESRGKLALVASTSLQDSRDSTPPEIDLRGTASTLASQRDPVVMDECTETWVDQLKQNNPEQFPELQGQRICLPLHVKDQFLGVLIVGDRVNGFPFSLEDLELLKSAAAQAANSLLNLQLSQRIVRSREMEAFQTMAAFFVHDLKNTASSLSLMLQNLPAQMENPSFRQDALRAVSKAVGKLNDLIGRLVALRQSVQVNLIEADLNQVIQTAVESVASTDGVHIVPSLHPLPKLRIDPEQIQKVAVNLVLNAREAIANQGTISISTRSERGWAVLSVEDSGCGMSEDFVRNSLFRPFKTTKKNGIGIGMFHCKTIVEAHQGRIEVESETGCGTTFRVMLPLAGGTN